MGLLEELLPPAAVAVEAFDDTVPAALFPLEEDLVATAVASRRAEFATARRCAREALAALGHPPVEVLAGPRREPLWPAGFAGSITHCRGYRAAAVARHTDVMALGIDAEPHEPLPSGILPSIALPQEIDRITLLCRDTPAICWDRLLFCAKEAVYKVWYPLTGRWLGFAEADIVFRSTEFEATLLVPGPQCGGTTLSGFTGRFTIAAGLILTAVTVSPPRLTGRCF